MRARVVAGKRMRSMVELSAEHDTLPRAELDAVCAVEGGRVVSQDGPVALADGIDPAALARRLALAHSISEHWASVAPTSDAIAAALQGRAMHGTVAVRARRLVGAHAELSMTSVARAAGAALGAKVDLEKPDVDVRVLVAAERAHIGRLVTEVDRAAFDARHVKHRAHFAPVSLHPRFARALVNLARIRSGDRIADPFVGTGGLALEAALVGARVYGSDLDERMVAGTRETLARFAAGARAPEIETHDVGDLPAWTGGQLDAVISDPPYGRASTTNLEPLGELYERFLDASLAALRPGGRLAVIFPSAQLRERAESKGFRVLESHEQRVHRSMTRHYGIFVRP